MPIRAVMIDDDTLAMRYYVDYLNHAGFTVALFGEPDDAVAYMGANSAKIDVVILDIMLPPGKYGREATNEGLRTGVYLYREIRVLCPGAPVLVLTNVRNPKTLAEFEEGPLLKVVRKRGYPPREVAELIRAMVESPRDKGTA
jgi:DNA-binding NarL/FixJ family response regulator